MRMVPSMCNAVEVDTDDFAVAVAAVHTNRHRDEDDEWYILGLVVAVAAALVALVQRLQTLRYPGHCSHYYY